MLQTNFWELTLSKTPHKMRSGELTYKFIMKDYVNADGLCKLYLQCFYKGKRKLFPLELLVEPNKWDAKAQECKGRSKQIKDMNLQLGQLKANANEILVRARLKNESISLEQFAERFFNPVPEFDFLDYYAYQLKARKNHIAHGTWKQQRSTLTKLREWRQNLPFSEIKLQTIKQFDAWLKNTKKNELNTRCTAIKNFKTYLNLAANQDNVPLNFDTTKIKVPKPDGVRTFLSIDELRKMKAYFDSEFCPDAHKRTLRPFLFSCFTGLRYSDLKALTPSNFIGNKLVLAPQKTKGRGKVLTITLTKNAMHYVADGTEVFPGMPSNAKGNKQLKEVAKQCGITRIISWHVARHTFATTFLSVGGSIENLKDLLGHSSIRETMVYRHIVNRQVEEQVSRLDGI